MNQDHDANDKESNATGVIILIIMMIALFLPYFELLRSCKADQKDSIQQTRTPVTLEKDILADPVGTKYDSPSNNTEASRSDDDTAVGTVESNDFPKVSPVSTKDDIIHDFAAPNQWRCACENGFLPQSLLKSFGGAEAVLRMGTGQCYHKNTTM